MRRTVNRVLLAAIGLVLLFGGLLTLIGGLDLPRHWGFTLPSWWPLDTPEQPLLSRQARTRWRDAGWWWPAVFAVLGALVLLCLGWFAAQFRSHRLVRVDVDSGEGEADRLRGRALEEVLEEEAQALDGVDRARVTLHGEPAAPQALFRLTLDSAADPAHLVGRLHREPLGRARDSTGYDAIPAEVRLRSDKHRASRVE